MASPLELGKEDAQTNGQASDGSPSVYPQKRIVCEPEGKREKQESIVRRDADG